MLGRITATARRIQAAILLLAALGQSGPAHATDLMKAWQAARDHDATFAAAQAAWAAGQTKHRQANALSLPVVEVSAGAMHGDQSSRTSGANFLAPGFGSSNDVTFNTSIAGGNGAQWGVVARQPLFDAGNRARAHSLNHEVELSDARMAQARADLALRVARAYFDVLIAQDTLHTLELQTRAAQSAAAEAQERFNVGDLPITDSLEAQARLDAIEARRIDAQNDLELKSVAFTDITQLPATDLQGFDPDASLATSPPSGLAQWLQRAEVANPRLLMARVAGDLARDQIDQFRALSSPRLSLVAQANRQQFHGDGDYGVARTSAASSTIGIMLSIPVFTGGMRTAQHDQAVADSDQARSELEQTRQQVSQQTRGAWLGVSQGIGRLSALAQALRSAERRLDATRLGLEAGARTTLDLVNAQSDALDARSAWSRARYEWLWSRLQLSAAAGELGEEQIAAASTSLRASSGGSRSP